MVQIMETNVDFAGSLYGDSAASRTFHEVNRVLGNPSAIDEVVGPNVNNAKGDIKRGPIPGLAEFLPWKPNGANGVSLLKRNKGVVTSATHSEVRSLQYLGKSNK